MAKIQTRPWYLAEHRKPMRTWPPILEAALEEGDPALVAAALGDIARAKGMAQIARKTGLGRESLYKALSPEGNPELCHRPQGGAGAWSTDCAPPRHTPKLCAVSPKGGRRFASPLRVRQCIRMNMRYLLAGKSPFAGKWCGS